MAATDPELRKIYQARINQVMDHIDQQLDQELAVASLAEIAHFSPYHFHRIFRAMVGEPLMQYIQRVRIEKAATDLQHHPDWTVTEVALACGYNSAAAFARAFKEHFGMSASAWRKTNQADRKISKDQGNTSERSRFDQLYLVSDFQTLQWKLMNHDNVISQVAVKDLPETPMAYVRHVGPYQGNDALFERLFGQVFQWAGPRGLLNFPTTKMLSVYHDNPHITEPEKLRLTLGITVPAGTEVSGEIGYMTLPAGKYAVARFEIVQAEYPQAWNSVYRDWLPESGFQPDDRPEFEIYQNDPKQHPEGKHIVDICIPVKPL